MPYCLASRLSFILTKSTPNESVSSSIFSSSANTLSHVKQLLASNLVIYYFFHFGEKYFEKLINNSIMKFVLVILQNWAEILFKIAVKGFHYFIS